MTRNMKIAHALNCVSKTEHFFPLMDRIFERKLGFAGEYVEVHPGKAIQELELRIEEQRAKLEQAEATLRKLREDAVVEADEALARATGD
jgi:hypothetical protein